MKLHTELLFNLLKEYYDVSRMGRNMNREELPLPVFYVKNSELRDGGVYIARSEELPRSVRNPCIIICAGRIPTNLSYSYMADVFYVSNPNLDVLTLFNTVQGIYQKISQWLSDMQALVRSNAPVEQLVEASIPIFEKRITITDYSLKIIANCAQENGKIVMTDKFTRVPQEIGQHIEMVHKANMSNREPFFVKEMTGELDRVVDNYCINLYMGTAYVGCCSLCEDLSPLTEADLYLFRIFADFVRRALTEQAQFTSNDLVSLKAIFSTLLENFPVSQSDLDRALAIAQNCFDPSGDIPHEWHALAIKSANRSKSLPAEYICATLEDVLPNAYAVEYEGVIAVFCLTTGKDDCEKLIQESIHPYLRDMNFVAGVSTPFTDIYKARDYYLQALKMLEIGRRSNPEKLVHTFEEEILHYMLTNCKGSFESDMLLTSGLLELRRHESAVDYWETLKCYLDCECNASQAAAALFVHRSTLIPRLDVLRKYIRMDTPEERLYLRMCVRMIDQDGWKK